MSTPVNNKGWLDALDHHLRSRFHRQIRWWHVHLFLVTALILVVAGSIAYLGGRVQQHRYDMAAIQQQYGSPQQMNVHIPRLTVPLLTTTTPPVASSRTIDFRYTVPPFSEGNVGQCACSAFTRAYSYLVSKKLGVHWLFSCAFWYPLLTKGDDVGSWNQQYPPLLSQYGGTLTTEYDWAVHPPQYDGPQPSAAAFRLAAQHRYTARIEVLNETAQAGPNIIPLVEKRLAQGFIVNVGQPVYQGPGANGLFSGNGGYEDIPSVPPRTLVLVGGHAADLIGYYRHLCLAPFGVQRCGWFLGVNSWGRVGYGLNCRTLQPQYAHGGCYLMSYAFARRMAFAFEVVHLTSARPRATPPNPATATSLGATGGVTDHGVPAPLRVTHHLAPLLSGAYYVHNVTLYDAPGDWGKTINTVAVRYGLYPPLLLATLRTECGFHSTSTICDNNWDGSGGSYGWCQVTTPTAAQFGVGGGYANAVRLFENYAPNCVYLAARVLANFAAYERTRPGGPCDLPPQNLYVAWNAGPGQPCWFLLNPSGLAASNFANFAVWYRIALSQALPFNPYAVMPFPVAAWGPKPHLLHGRPTWAASHYQPWFGRYLRERYVRGRHPHGAYMQYVFRHARLYCHFNSHACNVVRR